MEGLEGMSLTEGLDPNVVAGRGLDPTSIGRGLEGLDPNVDWIPTLLLEGVWMRRRLEGGWIRTSIGSGRCCWKEIGSDVDWRGLEGLDPDAVVERVESDVGVGRGFEGLDSDAVAGRQLEGSGRCCWVIRTMTLLLIIRMKLLEVDPTLLEGDWKGR